MEMQNLYKTLQIAKCGFFYFFLQQKQQHKIQAGQYCYKDPRIHDSKDIRIC